MSAEIQANSPVPAEGMVLIEIVSCDGVTVNGTLWVEENVADNYIANMNKLHDESGHRGGYRRARTN